MKQQGIKGKLIAVDAQKEPSLGTRFGIKGYPSVKYFKDGEFAFDVSLREEGPIGIIRFKLFHMMIYLNVMCLKQWSS